MNKDKTSKETVDKAIANAPQDLTEQTVIDLAGMTPLEYAKKIGPTAKACWVQVKHLERLVEAARQKLPKTEPVKEPIDVEALAATAGDLITDPDILTRFGKVIESAGLVGETRNAKILYLAVTSRLFDEKLVSVVVKGVSAGGKSFTVEMTLRFFPEAAYFARTSVSEKALYFTDESFEHRVLVIYEAPGMGEDALSYLFRTLLSEGHLSYEVAEKTDDGAIKARKIIKPGPTGLITTTTASRLHPENETRMLSLSVTDTRDQTKAVMGAYAGGDERSAVNYAPWQAFQAWLAAGECRIVVPFAKPLSDLIPPVAVRLRRDFPMLMSLIRAHALLHRGTRGTDAEGRIVATIDDYAAVRELIVEHFSAGLGATVSPIVRDTVEAVRRLIAAGTSPVSQGDLRGQLNLDKHAISNRVKQALSGGYLENLQDRRGRPAKLVLGDPLPDQAEILPTPPDLVERWNAPQKTEAAEGVKPFHAPMERYSEPWNGETVDGTVGGGTVPAFHDPKNRSIPPWNGISPSTDRGIGRPFQRSIESGGDRARPPNSSNGSHDAVPWGPFSPFPRPADPLDIPDFLRREVPPDRRPALGPPGDSLDDLA